MQCKNNVLFQETYPMLAASAVKISSNERSAGTPTIFMNGLNFSNSHWQIFHVNLQMIECQTTFLTMELINVTDVTVDNCLFGNLTFMQVEQVIISNSTAEGSLKFYNSSGSIENITTRDMGGLILQHYSYVQITKSHFVNNTVECGVVKVLSSSTMVMSDSTMQSNQSGAIFANRSFVQLSNTYFVDNKVDSVGGAILVTDRSSMQIQNWTFRNNQVMHEYTYENITTNDEGCAIYLHNSTAEMNDIKFIQNTARFGTAIKLKYHSMINVSNLKCENQRGYSSSCISASDSCSVSVYNSTFNMNTGSPISLWNNSILLVVSSTFFNNSTPLKGGAIYSYNSTLDVLHSVFSHNKAAYGGGAFLKELSEVAVNNCTFFNNSNTAVVISNNTSISIINSIFESNSSPYLGGAQLVGQFSVVNVSNTIFLKNSARAGGAVYANDHSLLVMSNNFFSENSALQTMNELNPIYKNITVGGGAIFTVKCELNIIESQFFNNSAFDSGGSLFSTDSSLLIYGTVFESNVAGSSGGAISTFDNSSIIIETSLFADNNVQDKAVGNGGGLSVQMNSTAIASNVHFMENKAQKGGAIYSSILCELTISNNTIESNTGSAIFLKESVYLHILNSRFLNNSVRFKGGAIHSGFGNVISVSDTVFRGNKASASGGSFFGCSKTNVSFYNCLFTDNSAFKGGSLTGASSNVQFIDCNFTRNSATNGGIFATSGNLLLVHCLMKNNTADGDGGVGYLEENSNITVMASVFKANSAVGYGGVFWIRKGNVSIMDTSIVHNRAGHRGGVIDSQNSNINISQTACWENAVKGGNGGVLAVEMGTSVSISDANIQNNSARAGGAMLIDTDSVLEICHSQINGNYAEVLGGAFGIQNNSLLVAVNSSFTGNSGYHAGSIVIKNGTGYLENCTLTGNQGTVAGAINIASSDFTLSNTVFLENKAQEGDIHCEASQTRFINKLYTFHCEFKHGNDTSRSDGTDFKQIAEQKQFIGHFCLFYHTMKETQFASSKNVVRIILLAMIVNLSGQSSTLKFIFSEKIQLRTG